MPRGKAASPVESDAEFSDLSDAASEHSSLDNIVNSGRRSKRQLPDSARSDSRAKRRKSNGPATYKEESGSEKDADQPVNGTSKLGNKTTKNRRSTTDETPVKAKNEVKTLGSASKSPKSKSTNKPKVEVGDEEETTLSTKVVETSSKTPNSKKKAATTKSDPDHNEVEVKEDSEDNHKVKKKRKTKEQKKAEAMPLAERTAGSLLKIGAHVSGAGGVHNAVDNCIHIGGNAFALFLKSQRKWENPALKPEHATMFKASCEKHEYSAGEHILPHGSYLVNLCTADPAKGAQAYNSFIDDLNRCEALGIKLYNFHPGNTNGFPRADAIKRLAERLNTAHKATSSVITVLENMAASSEGNTVGGAFEDLRDVITLVEDKSRVGVCLDTCHAFAGGYDLRTPDAFRATMANFDEVIGNKYLRAVHLNDSKAPFNSHRDLHQQIGLGFLGLRAFHNVMNDSRFHGLPIVLETPIDHKDDNGKVVEDKNVWAREIKLLESLVGMDAEGEKFRELEAELAKKGEVERKKLQEQFDKKQEKDAKGKGKGKGKRKAAETSDEESSNE